MPRVGILGGGGFLGWHLARALQEMGREVRVFSRTIHRRDPGIEYTRGMLEDQNAVADWLRGCEELLYLAHNTAVSPYQDHDRFVLMSNIDPFVQTLQTARACGVRKFLFMSSGGAVYGPAGEELLSEQCVPRPVSAYGLAKLTMENYLRMFCVQHGLGYLILRPSNPYGPGQSGRRNQGVVAIFLRNALLGAPIEVWGETSTTKDYLYVEDFIVATTKLMAAGYDNSCYNVCSGRGTTLAEIIDIIQATTGRRLEIRAQPARPNDVRKVRLDPTRMQQRISWVPQVDLATGIRQTCAWLRSHPAELQES